MVSMTIFSIIITIGMGSLVSVMNVYKTSQKQKQVYDSLNYVFESVTREIRLGENYRLGAYAGSGSVQDGISTRIGFDSSDGRGYVEYYINDGILYAYRSSTTNTQESTYTMTDKSQIFVENIRFSVLGTTLDNKQPFVWIQIQAKAKGEDRLITLQSLVSQRSLDV